MDDLKGLLVGDKPLDGSYLEAYAKIKIMMTEKSTVIHCMQALGNELGELRDRREEAGFARFKPKHDAHKYVRLSEALAKYEQYCWFPPSHELFIGFVPHDEFMRYIARGLMPKDPGAGLAHGDFTHRLHWHAIARVITANFTVAKSDGWNHSPLELYTSLGQGQALAANMWFKLLDDNADKHFTSPDKFHKHVREGGYGVLSETVSKRYLKREQAFNALVDQKVLAERKASFVWVPHIDPQLAAKGVTMAPHQHYLAQVGGQAGEAYGDRKKQQYQQVGDLPVVTTDATEDKLTLAGRIALSRTRLNKTAEGNAQEYSLAHDRKLGMVSRLLSTKSRGLPRVRPGELAGSLASAGQPWDRRRQLFPAKRLQTGCPGSVAGIQSREEIQRGNQLHLPHRTASVRDQARARQGEGPHQGRRRGVRGPDAHHAGGPLRYARQVLRWRTADLRQVGDPEDPRCGSAQGRRQDHGGCAEGAEPGRQLGARAIQRAGPAGDEA
jgi:hypothetical protein